MLCVLLRLKYPSPNVKGGKIFYAEVSVHNQMTLSESGMAEGQPLLVVEDAKSNKRGRRRSSLLLPVMWYEGYCPRMRVALTLINPALEHESITNSGALPGDRMRIW